MTDNPGSIHTSNPRVFVRCRQCGRIVLSRVPRDGDGTARLPHRHRTRDGRPCDGHLFEAEWIKELP